MEVGLGPGDFVFDGNPARPRKRHSPNPILAHVYCGQRAWWIKMPLGTEVKLGPGNVVLDGVAAPPPKGHSPQLCLLWPNGWLDENATLYGSRHRPRPHCVRRGPSSPTKGAQRPLFSAHVYCSHGRSSQLLLSSCIFCELSLKTPIHAPQNWGPPQKWGLGPHLTQCRVGRG